MTQISSVVQRPQAEIQNMLDSYTNSLPESKFFDPKKFSAFVASNCGFEYKEIYRIFINPKTYVGHLYADTLSTLSKLKENYTISVFSEGNIKFLETKIRHSGLAKFFESVWLFDDKTTERVMSKLPKNAVYFDDKRSVVERYADKGFNIFWVNRDGENHAEIPTINSLSEIIRPGFLNNTSGRV